MAAGAISWHHCPKYKYNQMLYLTSFKILADFLNNLNFLEIFHYKSIFFLFFLKKNVFFPAILLKLIIL